MIFEGIGPYSAIGRVSMQGVQLALEAGWEVTVVAKYLDESLRDKVEWLPLYVPPKLFFLQWTTALHFIKKALGNRKFDVIHAHQPQVADLADVFQCHYLTRAAYERRSLTGVRNTHTAIIRAQEQGVLYVEDYFYKHWNPRTHMLYDSHLTSQDFHRLYGVLPREDVRVYSFPKVKFPTERERRLARSKVLGFEPEGLVIGFLGGLHQRKGYRRLINAMAQQEGTFLLMGGQYSDGFEAPELKGRMKSVGLVEDIRQFYYCCDAFAVVSHYEPLGLVSFEAAAHGVPVVSTQEVGATPHLVEYGAGVRWEPEEPFIRAVEQAVAQRDKCQEAALKMEQDLGSDAYGKCILDLYQQILDEKSAQGS
jgi:glycosyltransferase involved in cell wall biosynthesis